MNTTPKDLRVVAAAIRTESGEVYSVSPPGRHHDVLRLMRESGAPRFGSEQGFVLSDGRWARRKPAYLVAKRAGQLLERAPTAGHWEHGLFSEDVW